MIETRRRLPLLKISSKSRGYLQLWIIAMKFAKKNSTFLSATRVGAAACFDLRAAECLHRESLALASHLQSQFN